MFGEGWALGRKVQETDLKLKPRFWCLGLRLATGFRVI